MAVTINGSGELINQVVQTWVDTATFSTNSSSITDITGLSVTITPTSTSSKILVMYSVTYGGSNNSNFCDLSLKRNGTVVGSSNEKGGNNGKEGQTGNAAGVGGGMVGQVINTNFQYLDSPATTSAVTYQIACRPSGSDTFTFYLNRPENITDNNRVWGSSQITVMEISG